MSNTTSSTIRGKIAELLAGRAKTDEQIAELRKEEAWAAKEEYRAEVRALAAEAEQLVANAVAANSEMLAEARTAAESLRRLGALVDNHNAALGDVRQRIAAKGINNSPTPASPLHAGVGVNGATLIIDSTHIVSMDRAATIRLVFEAANHTDTDLKLPPSVIDKPLPDGQFWINRDSGVTLIADRQPYNCEPISRAEYLSHLWGLHLADLPQHILDELTPVERGRVAGRLIDELDDEARAEFADQLLPTRKGSAA